MQRPRATTTSWFLFIFLIAPCRFSAAQEEQKPRVRAERLNAEENVQIDGRLSEVAWQRAIPASDFIQQDPNLGSPATERTEVRFLLGRSSLYIGVVCHDSEPDKLVGNSMQRDASMASDDRFQWTFDPYLDGRSGYLFEVNPSGAMGDSLLSSSANNELGGSSGPRAWDGIWYAKVSRGDTGWTIEAEIPFRTLNFDPNAPAWGANFQRSVRRKNEESLWTGWARNQGVRRMSVAGLLEGISDVTQGIGFDVQPFVTGSYIDAPGRNLESSFDPDIGVDFTYSITPQLKGKFTINTDFAETEVDQRRVNLTRFPLFFPEKRSFFLEGTTVFEFGREPGNAIVPFFSRRIGLDADGHPQRIDYGAKVTGQIGANDVGLLQVRTATSDDLVGEDFTVFRTKRRFLRESYAGLLYTRRAARTTGVDDRHTVGVDFALGTSRFRGSQNLEVSGYYLRTSPNGTTDGSSMYGFRFDYPNTLWDARVSLREVQPGYDPAVGFIDRRNFRLYAPAVAFIPRPKNNRLVRNFLFEANIRLLTDLDNRMLTRTLDSRIFQVDFQSGDAFRVHIIPTYERLERDFQISSGVKLPSGNEYDFTRYRAVLATASRRVLSVTTQYENGTFYSGHRRDFTFNVGLRPRRGVLINLNSEWNRVELPEGNFSTRLLRLNANNQFNPWISVVTNVQYDSVSRIIGWQSRFRWILRPGNDLYFVWAQNWLDDPAGRLMLDRTAATKITYTHQF